jgi:hypothetical protein
MNRAKMLAAAVLAATCSLLAVASPAQAANGALRVGQTVTNGTASYKVVDVTTDYHRAKTSNTLMCFTDVKPSTTATTTYKIKGTTVKVYRMACGAPLSKLVRW